MRIERRVWQSEPVVKSFVAIGNVNGWIVFRHALVLLPGRIVPESGLCCKMKCDGNYLVNFL